MFTAQLASLLLNSWGKVDILTCGGFVVFFWGRAAFFRPRGQDCGDSSVGTGSTLHPCAPSKGFALELMRGDSFSWDVVGGSSACTFSKWELEHPLLSHQQRDGGRNHVAKHQPVTPASFFTSPVSWHLSKLYQPHLLFVCLFLHLSPADNVKNWDFSCTGGQLGQETFSNSGGTVIPNPPILPVTGPQEQAGLWGWGIISPSVALLLFYSSPSSPSPETSSRSSLALLFFPTGFCIPLPAGLVCEVVVWDIPVHQI